MVGRERLQSDQSYQSTVTRKVLAAGPPERLGAHILPFVSDKTWRKVLAFALLVSFVLWSLLFFFGKINHSLTIVCWDKYVGNVLSCFYRVCLESSRK